MQKKTTIQLAGWYGVLAILGAYTLISFNILHPQDITYQVLNLTDASGVIIETYVKKDAQPLILNIFWFLIAALAILRMVVG